MITSIKWVVYDGTAMTRPHSIKVDEYDLPKSERDPLWRIYLLRRSEQGVVENQGYHLKPRIRYDDNLGDIFRGWIWEGHWPDYAENEIQYPLTIGDAWAEWPLPPQPEAQP